MTEMSDTNNELEQYLQEHSTPENRVLDELNRYTHLHAAQPRMLSGQILGNLLRMISQMIKPRYILEIGTFTGYSAICLAEGLVEDGKLVTIEINDENEDICRQFFVKAGIDRCTELLVGDALQIVPGLQMTFDLVFIDANKEQYIEYYDRVIDKTQQGGFIIVDNVLWDGRVFDRSDQDATVRAIDQFNKYVTEDPGVENVLLPVRDGIMIIKKL